MQILVVNPNTSRSMTETIRAAAALAVSPGTRITAANPATGPESIEGKTSKLGGYAPPLPKAIT